MSALFSAGIRFSAKEQITGPIKAMTARIHSFSNSISADMARAQVSVSKLKSTFGGITSYLSVAGIAAFSNKAIELSGIQGAAIANVEAGIRSTNNLLGISSRELQDMAGKLQLKSIFGNETILQNVTAQMQTFTNVGKENFGRVQQAALDVTSKLYGLNATGESLRTTSIMLGKAMNDPAQGMSALRRVGISFSEQTTKNVKALVAQGKAGAAQVLMLKEIETQYGGAAKALAETAKGQELVKRNAIGDQMERLGALLEPIKRTLLDIASTGIKFINFLLYNPVGNVILGAVAAWKAYELVMMAVAAIQTYHNTLQLTGISRMKLLMLAIGAITGVVIYLVKNWDNFSDSTKRIIKIVGVATGTIGTLIGVIKAVRAAQVLWNIAMSANPIGLIVATVATGIAALTGLITGLARRWEGISKAFKEGGFLEGIKAIGKALLSIILQPIEWILKAIGKITGAKWATNWSRSIEGLRGNLDKGLLKQTVVTKENKEKTEAEKPVNPLRDQALFMQRSILETNNNQNVQINIDDSTGRARLSGQLQPVPVTIRNTKGGFSGF
jgi:hypothetical protein